MGKMVKEVKSARETEKVVAKGGVVNYMGGISYEINPIDTLKLVTASSIFGEPQYYRRGKFSDRVKDGAVTVDALFEKYLVLDKSIYDGRDTSTVMEDIIDKALSYDFKATLEWAVTLRKEYNMRLNPQIIMVRAAIHEGRKAFTEKNPGKFAEYNKKVMSRADEPATQLTYYLFKNGSKNNVPGLLKKNWASRIEEMTPYELYKYRNSGIGIIDTVRVCHANNNSINELMKTGTIELPPEDKTWETMRATGATWKEILTTVKVHHMALLKNLRGIFTEIDDIDFCKETLENLKKGVRNGKQFPFRYKTAYEMIKKSDVHHKALILDALEECIDIACDNMPKLSGKTVCLSDNSGSAWGTLNSEYGSVTVANIDNLSSVITAKNSDEGYVGKFGDELHMIPISKRNVLSQTNDIEKNYHVGGNTENGIWLFFDKALRQKEHYDNIFIYSDMQAGHGGLYGKDSDMIKCKNAGFACNPNSYYTYIDVAKLIDTYRKTVNPKVNVFCVQTAGYNNVLIPESGYRTTIMYGWTGKELVYADVVNKFWDEYDKKNGK